jgi:hypothetical protein
MNGTPFAVFDELFAPQRHKALQIIDVQRELPIQSEADGEPVESLTIRIQRSAK